MTAVTDRPIDLFVHIPKTAGTTMTQVLKRNYPQPRTFFLGSVVQPKIAEFMALPAEKQAHFWLVVGHMSYGIHASLEPSRPYRYFTMLRDPIERVISLYYFIYRNPAHYLYDPVVTQKFTIAQFLAYEGSFMARNAQTRFLCGLDVMPYVGPVDAAAFELAKSNLRNNILVTGLTERFDESLLLYRKAFGWKQIHYTRENVTSNRAKQRDLTAEDMAALQEYTRHDIALYAFAKSRFEAQIAAYGPAFEQDLARFQFYLRNMRYLEPLQQAYARARTVSVRTYMKNWLGRGA